MLKISAFYLDKQKSFVPPQKYKVYQVSRIGAFHKRHRQLRKGGGVKNWLKLLTDSSKKTADMGEGSVKKSEKLPTSFINGPIVLSFTNLMS
jgi:hypothetical protein